MCLKKMIRDGAYGFESKSWIQIMERINGDCNFQELWEYNVVLVAVRICRLIKHKNIQLVSVYFPLFYVS